MNGFHKNRKVELIEVLAKVLDKKIDVVQRSGSIKSDKKQGIIAYYKSAFRNKLKKLETSLF
jgi:hypothetical protein